MTVSNECNTCHSIHDLKPFLRLWGRSSAFEQVRWINKILGKPEQTDKEIADTFNPDRLNKEDLQKYNKLMGIFQE